MEVLIGFIIVVAVIGVAVGRARYRARAEARALDSLRELVQDKKEQERRRKVR